MISLLLYLGRRKNMTLDQQTEELFLVGGEWKFLVLIDGVVVSERPATQEEIDKAEQRAEEAASKLEKINDGKDPPRW
jgi:hypothetical protein